MKQKSFQSFLWLWAGLSVAIAIEAFFFKHLHWPGGEFLTTVATPIFLLVLSICMLCYLPKYGALKPLNKADIGVAKHLLRVEISAFAFAIPLAIGLIFRALHWPGSAQIILFSCMALVCLSIIAGIMGCVLAHKK